MPPPGTVLDHSPARTGVFLASPGVARLPGGAWVAKGDEHGPGSTESTRARTRLYRSEDDGRTWRRLHDVDGMYWASLFVHRDALWLLGTARNNGPIVLRRSDDGGESWGDPTRGVLRDDGRYHGAPTPGLEAHGRLWRGFEAVGTGGWGRCFSAFLLSAPVDADLFDPRAWTATNRHGFDPAYLGGRFGGWCEGNAVALPDGAVGNLLRVHTTDLPEQAALLTATADGRRLDVDPARAFVAMPGGCKKFTVRRDPREGGAYWTLASVARRLHPDVPVERTRNELALLRSPDLRRWETRAIVLAHPDPTRHGFQYVDWAFDGDDILAVARTAWDDDDGGARSQHDANFLTVHRIAEFRTLRSLSPVAK